MQSNPRRLESSTLTTLPTSSQGRGPTWPNHCRNICSVHLAWKFANSGSHVQSNSLFTYFSCKWNILDTSHASGIFRMFLIQVEYFGYFLCEWNIFDTFHAIENFTEICSRLQLTHRVTSREKLEIDGKFTKLKSWWCARWEIIPNCGVKRALWLSLISLPSCCINASTDEPSPHSQMCIWSIINKIKQSPPCNQSAIPRCKATPH